MLHMILSFLAVSVLVLVASDPCVPPGDFLSGLTGTFSSPNFSANFPTNSHCNWTIEVPAGRIIKVTFFSFALDPTHNTNCLGDTGIPHVFISNVASDDAASEFKICGARLPNPVYSVGNSIQVRLVTGTNGYQGFNASYEAIDEGQLCPESVILTERTGVIQSPYNPRKYPDNLTCIWEITAPQGNHVKLEIDALNIQECDRATCPCDYLQIYDAFSKDPNDNKRICGPQSSKIFYSIHESLKVQFVSDGTKSKRFEGFKATYTILRTTPPICPREAISLLGNGKFSSPNYPLTNFPPHRNCSWNITVPPERRVNVQFPELALGSCQSNDECTYVELYDGPSAKSSLLGRFYNGSTTRRVLSSGNQVFVNFRSGSSLDWGFEAQYEPLSMNLSQSNQTTGGPHTVYLYGIVSVTDHTAVLRLTGKEYLSNGNGASYIQIIIIQRKDEDQDIGSSTDETYAADKVKDSSEEGKPYIIAQFDYGDEETFTIGDDKYYKTEDSTKYHNGKLESNTHYAAFQRSFDGSGSYDSEKFVKFKTPEKPGISLTVFIVVVVVVALVLGISGAVGGFLYAKRRWKLVPVDSNKEMEDVSPYKIPVSKSDTSF